MNTTMNHLSPRSQQCAACQKKIPPGDETAVTLEKYTHNVRTVFACCDECADILRREE